MTGWHPGVAAGGLLAVCAALCACSPGGGGAGGGFRPVDPDRAVLWDRQINESAALFRELAAEFNAGRAGVPVEVQHAGSYADIFRKVSASIQAGVLPAMAVSYESMTTEYAAAGAAVPLDPLLNDPETGIPPDELADYYPAMLESNRYAEHGGGYFSFPLSKSLLVLFYNTDLVARAGFSGPPATWDAFLEQCRAVRRLTGKPAHAVNVDCSTVNGLIFSMGGEVYRNGETLYDSPAALAVFELYETLVREKLAYVITAGSFDDNVALVKGEVAFTLRQSSARNDLVTILGERRNLLGIAPIPQKDPARPATVVYGPNVTLFPVGDGQTAAAWAFVKWFTRPDISARWSAGTGYLPVRRSALEEPVLRRLWEEWPPGKVPYDCLAFAKSEPNVAGWQEVRDIVGRALLDVLTGTKTAAEAIKQMKPQADAALRRAAGNR